MVYPYLEGSNVLEAILKLFRSFRRPVAMSAPAVADGNSRNLDKPRDTIDYSESCYNMGFIAFLMRF